MSDFFRVEFPHTSFPSIELPKGVRLAVELTAVNSPILFGCRSGICGTCLVEADYADQAFAPPSSEEKEVLEIFAPGNRRARLACQLRLTGNLRLRKLEAS